MDKQSSMCGSYDAASQKKAKRARLLPPPCVKNLKQSLLLWICGRRRRYRGKTPVQPNGLVRNVQENAAEVERNVGGMSFIKFAIALIGLATTL